METLETFKQGYIERDTTKLDKWFSSVFYDDCEVIGTFAIDPGDVEWKNTRSQSIRLFKSDWIRWGDMAVDLSKARIAFKDNFAWVNFSAVITRNPENSTSRTAQESYANMLRNVEKLINSDDSKSEEMKLHTIAYYSNLVMYQYNKGEEYVWPIRITGTMQKENGVWKFRQVHYSYPNRGFPNVRY